MLDEFGLLRFKEKSKPDKEDKNEEKDHKNKNKKEVEEDSSLSINDNLLGNINEGKEEMIPIPNAKKESTTRKRKISFIQKNIATNTLKNKLNKLNKAKIPPNPNQVLDKVLRDPRAAKVIEEKSDLNTKIKLPKEAHQIFTVHKPDRIIYDGKGIGIVTFLN